MEDATDFLKHYGILRRSGRYPWGSGNNPNQRNKAFLDYVDEMEKSGMTLTQIAAGLGIVDSKGKATSTPIRRARSIANAQLKEAQITTALRLKEKNMSNVAAAAQMGINESSFRALIDPAARERNAIIATTAEMLRRQVEEKKYLDIGSGTENHLGISSTKLRTAIQQLEDEGYSVHFTNIEQVGNPGKFTTLHVLVPPGVTAKDVYHNKGDIKSVAEYSEDGGRSFLGVEPPVQINPRRVAIRYKEQGGDNMDGVIELRRGVDDISLGHARYAQVRIQIGPEHYAKGMAIYSDDLPDGVDIRFNTNKSDTGNKLDSLKPLKRIKELDPETKKMVDSDQIDEDNPFGSTIRQNHYIDVKTGAKKLRALNIVGSVNPLDPEESTSGEEGGWSKWTSKISSQALSKQPLQLAKQQLDLTYDVNKAELDEILSLTNPTIKRHLLVKYADNMDSKAVKLQAAGLPRTANKVILPINSLKDDEIYAPTFNDGERVVLIRHPHGGIFEIPELTVNNKNRQANRLIKNAIDAVGINANVARRLSGADFDGDTVLVIPQGAKRPIKTKKPFDRLLDFDPKIVYKGFEGMKPMGNTQTQMGIITNLVTDMTIQKATDAEITRAVRHSMVVIDAERHNLNYRQSYLDHGIKELQQKYQPQGGATTLISRASSTKRIPQRVDRKASDGGPIDLATGKRVYTPTGETYVRRTVNKRTGAVTERIITKEDKLPKLALVDDAFELSSGTPMEAVYATHANKLKALANEARKVAVSTKRMTYDTHAAKVYEGEVRGLNAKLTTALKNPPLERQAQIAARMIVDAKKKANPHLNTAEKKKMEGQALREARLRNNARKQRIPITQAEWKAIQAGAISDSKLIQILNNTDLDLVRELATPRKENSVMTTALSSRAKIMLANGHTQAEVASALGVPTSTLASFIERG